MKIRKQMEHMIKTLSNYRYRSVWVLFALISTFLSWLLRSNVLLDGYKPLDVFGYYGTIGTIIALVITICEVLQTSKLSKTITDSIEDRIASIEIINSAISLTECASLVDSILDKIEDDKYNEATILIRELRKCLIQTKYVLMEKLYKIDNKQLNYSSVERSIESYRSSDNNAPVTKQQKSVAKGYLIAIRNDICSINPGKK